MHDFLLGLLTSLAVLVVTLVYMSHVGSDIRGTSVLHESQF